MLSALTAFLLSLQVVHILNMTTAQVHSFQLTPDESLHSLQKRIEAETRIEVVNQELLQETGVSLDPRKPAAQCVLDGVVRLSSLDFTNKPLLATQNHKYFVKEFKPSSVSGFKMPAVYCPAADLVCTLSSFRSLQFPAANKQKNDTLTFISSQGQV